MFYGILRVRLLHNLKISFNIINCITIVQSFRKSFIKDAN